MDTVEKNKLRVKKWRDENRERVKEVNKAWRVANPSKVKAIRKKSDEKHEEARKIRKKAYKSENKHKIQAHALVSRALKKGYLIKLPCHVCDSSKTQAHHEDYSKPLDVLWLCQEHHSERHEEFKHMNAFFKRDKKHQELGDKNE